MAPKFIPLGAMAYTNKLSKANHWLYIALAASSEGNYVLELSNPRLNTVEFYVFKQGKLSSRILTGDARPFASRIFQNYNWVLPLQLDNSPTEVFIKINKPNENIQFDLKLTEANRFFSNNQAIYLAWGLLAGFVLLILLINAVIWLATKSSIYGYYFLLTTVVAFNIGAASGLFFQYIWPNSPWVNSLYPQTFSTWLTLFCQLAFMQKFIGQTAKNSRVYILIQWFKGAIVCTLIICFILVAFKKTSAGFFNSMVLITLFFNFSAIPLALGSIFERIKKREKIILFFSYVTLFKAITLLVYLLNFKLKFINFDYLSVVLVNFIFDLIVLSIGVIYFGFYKYKHENEQLLTSLYQQKQTQSSNIINALELERNRIAEDLYDDVGAMLATAVAYLSNFIRKNDMGTHTGLQTTRSLLDRAIENLRNVSHNLMPKNFAELGLVKSLDESIRRLPKDKACDFQFLSSGAQKALAIEQEIQIFRIASELIYDILKNSGASKATLQLIYHESYLVLMAEDNGTGAPIHNNLESKVAFINASLEIDFGPNGLCTTIVIPY